MKCEYSFRLIKAKRALDECSRIRKYGDSSHLITNGISLSKVNEQSIPSNDKDDVKSKE